jgi:uncharacterized repeat protein (TIGR01451 family)
MHLNVSIVNSIRRRHFLAWLIAISLLIGGLILFWAPVRAWSPRVEVQKAVEPSQVPAGRLVTYEITVQNQETTSIAEAELVDLLPSGFRYVPGSTHIYRNGLALPKQEPVVAIDSGDDQKLTWSNLEVPSARVGSYYGMHTFVQDRCRSDDINYQLDRVQELMGPGAFVKQLFYRITPATSGPLACWVDFVNRAYDRDLIPVIRLQGEHGGPYWLKPQKDGRGSYRTIAEAYKRVVQGLPRRDGHKLYVEIWNEPNLNIEWSGAVNPTEYGEFLVAVSAAIRELGDPRIVILNGALSPGGDQAPLAFIDGMAAVPGALEAFDVWASHPYPGNHPPDYNIHNGTATYRNATIDSYLLELERLAIHGRENLQVLLTETGYALHQNTFQFEGYPAISEQNRADYIKRAFRDYWRYWPEVIGVCPFELVDPGGDWWVWDWLHPDGRRHWQYDAVLSMAKEQPLVPGRLRVRFQARAGHVSGTHRNDARLASRGAVLATVEGTAPVHVLAPTATPSPTVSMTPTPTVTGTPPTPTPTPICADLVANGDFEKSTGWQLNRASIQNALVYEGQAALRLGLDDDENNVGYSSASQRIALPADKALQLGFWYYPRSDDSGTDLQIVRILDDQGNLLENLIRDTLNGNRWDYFKVDDLSAYAGQTVTLYFAVINDGEGDVASLYVDDVQFLSCPTTPTPTATPSMTSTPTASPSPTTTPTVGPSPTLVCWDLIRNGGFEQDGEWQTDPTDPYPATYSDLQAYSGQRALQLGIVDQENAGSYSSAWQLVHIPSEMMAPWLTLWYYPVSSDTDADRQYILLLDQDDGFLDEIVWGGLDAKAWQHRTYDMSAFRGQWVKLYFGVHNDGLGGSAALYVDEVQLEGCLPAGVAPTPNPRKLYLPLVLKGHVEKVLAITPQTEAGAPAKIWSLGQGTSNASPRMSLNEQTGQLYVSAGEALEIWDPEREDRIAVVPMGPQIADLFHDPLRKRTYISDRSQGWVWVWDDVAQELVSRLGPLSGAGGLAVAGDRLYVADTYRNQVGVFDVNFYELLQRIPIEGAPYALAANPVQNTVVVAAAGANQVVILDRFDTQIQTVVSLGGMGYPRDLVINLKDGDIYVLYALTLKYDALAVIDGSTYEITRTIAGDTHNALRGVRDLALAPDGATLYVAGAQGVVGLDARDFSTEIEFDAEKGGMITQLEVSPTGRLYALDGLGTVLHSWPLDVYRP